MKPVKMNDDIPVWSDKATRALVEDIIDLLSERHPDLADHFLLHLQHELALTSLIDKCLLASHKILLAKGILRIRLLSMKQSGSAMSTEMKNFSKGYMETVWKA